MSGGGPYTFEEILRLRWNEDYRLTLEDWSGRHPAGVRAALGCSQETEVLGMLGAELLRTESVFDQPMQSFAADLVVRATYRLRRTPSAACGASSLSHFVTAPPEREPGTGEFRKSGEFRLRYALNLNVCHDIGGVMIAPLCRFPKDRLTQQRGLVTDEYLLPLLREEDYVPAARFFLQECYPSALSAPTAVNGRLAAQRLGLKVRRVYPAEESAEQGRILFEDSVLRLREADGSVREERLEAGTVLINGDLCRTRAAENETVLHELAHYFLHRLFFGLQRMRPEDPPFRGEVPADRLERQAARLPGYLLMEENQARKELARLLRSRGGDRGPESIAWMLEMLCRRFQVSPGLARQRMLELGFPEAAGVGLRTDGRRVPDHGCGESWPEGCTYVVPLREALRLFRSDAAFRAALESGHYAYAEGHFCLREEKYLREKPGRPPWLTDYGRRHMDECCLRFAFGEKVFSGSFRNGQAARLREDREHYQPLQFLAEPESRDRVKENRRFIEEARLWEALLREIPREASLKEALEVIRLRRGLSWEEIAARIGVDRKTLMRWVTREDISLPHLTALCVALNLPPELGRELVRISECPLRRTEHAAVYRRMIDFAGMAGMDVARCNEMLRQEGLPPLHESGESLAAAM